MFTNQNATLVQKYLSKVNILVGLDFEVANDNVTGDSLGIVQESLI